MTSYAQNPDRQSLKGIKGFHVTIEDIPPDAEQHGLGAETLRTAIELRLRKAGIKVYDDEQWKKDPRFPVLYLRLFLHKSVAYQTYATLVELQVQQWVRIDAIDFSMLAATWSREQLGTAGPEFLPNVKRTVEDFTDTFINDYLAANPKQ